MNKITLLLVTFSFLTRSNAQDMLYFKGDPQAVRSAIKRENAVMVWYRTYPDFTHKVTYKHLLDSIVYEDGGIEYCAAKKSGTVIRDARKREGYAAIKDNVISAGFGIHRLGKDPFVKTLVVNAKDFDPVFALHISYEYFFADKRLGIEASPYIGLNRKAAGVLIAPRFYTTRFYKWQFGFGPEYEFDAQKLDSGYLKTSAISFSGKLVSNITPDWSIQLRFNVGGVVNSNSQNRVLTANHYSYQASMLYGIGIGAGYRF